MTGAPACAAPARPGTLARMSTVPPPDVRPDPELIFGASLPFARLCGIEALDVQEGRTRLRVRLEERHGNNLGVAHGGLVATLLDVAMGTAARMALGDAVLTLDMHVSFLAAGRGTLLAEGRVVRAGGTVVFAEAEARTEDGEVVARASGVMRRVRRRAAEA